jgi:hypothetical protein
MQRNYKRKEKKRKEKKREEKKKRHSIQPTGTGDVIRGST